MLKIFKKPDVKEQVREAQRDLRQGTRDVDREVVALRREEEKLIREIKAAAKAGNTPATRVLAKSLVRLRSQVAKLQGSSAQLKGIGTQITAAPKKRQAARAPAAAAAEEDTDDDLMARLANLKS
ncbi:Vacuolar protein sorting-associated protein 2 3 [Tetrabaena socialis]|uniref:Vacuolar protein sorting-associated protein 2 3 n=1 Tax=Tetrabaena socialis TaxID=47790 RepID=A0A2J8AAJ6_9CHLO|nr:Vacuolar protein sorting-associated protein 2 3 [Tetrabaena socialis]|eukprot:PNH09542.1 Vacuolar protein sorting-associated protein 2 3 [Tetrabaena socialis]